MTLLDAPAAPSSTAPGSDHEPSAGSDPARRGHGVLRGLLVLAVVWYLVTGLWQAAHDAPTVDEAVDVSAGVATLVRHDLRMNPEHGPLPKVLSALPALAAQPVVPDGASWRDGDWFAFTDDFVRANRDAGRLDLVLFLARLVPLAEGLGCAWFIGSLARRFFGRQAGLVAALLWVTTPVVVGLSHLAGIDVAFTLATLFVADRLVRHHDAPTVRTAAALGAACGVALLTRHSALGLWLYAALAAGAVVGRRDRRAAARAVAVVVLVAVLTVWVGVRVLAPTGASSVAAARADATVAAASAQSVAARAALAVPFPTEWRSGLAYLVVTSDERPAYLFGQAWDGSRLWFFPGSVLAKVPLGALGAMLVGAVFAARRRDVARRRLAVGVVGPAAVSFAFVLAQPLNLGVRYVLPSIALAMVLAGAIVDPLVSRITCRVCGGTAPTGTGSGTAAAPGCELASSAARSRTPEQAGARPWAGRGWASAAASGVFAIGVAMQGSAVLGAGVHSLAWTAPPFTPAYRWVSDSNLDYGQDLGLVEDWAGEHPGAFVALLRPRGVDNPAGTRELRGTSPAAVQGWAAVSATRLTVLDRDELSWLRAYCPVGDLGGSVLLYRFAAPVDASPGPVMPARPCVSGAASSTRG